MRCFVAEAYVLCLHAYDQIGERLSRLTSATERLKQVAYTNGSHPDSIILQMLENYGSVTLDKLYNMLTAARKG